MNAFSFETTPRVICEDGAASKLGALALDLGFHKLLLVTDPGLVAAGLLEGPLESLGDVGISVELFSDVAADPPQGCVEKAVEAARDSAADAVVGLGGGSSMDTAKLAALLARSGQGIGEVFGVEVAKGPRLGLIQIPTTAGTGSEVTPIAIVTTPTDEKKGVVSRLLYPDLAILDAELTLGLSPATTAMTGVDAMVHAIEAYTTKLKKNAVSDALAVKALRLLSSNIGRAVANGRDIEARRAMLQGAMLAGMAFANAPVGAVHALAYPLGGHFHVPHGLSNALVLMPVLEFNLPTAEALYAELAEAVEGAGPRAGANAAARGLFERLEAIVRAMPMPQRLREVGVTEGDLPMLAEDAMKVQRLLVNNPREVAYEDALSIYRKVL